MSEFKKGDRVRVTFEAVVFNDSAASGWVNVSSGALSNLATAQVEHVEKLADPEPVWVNGDLVRRTPTAFPIARIDGRWLRANGFSFSNGEVSQAWHDGDLEVLYKADA